MSTDGLIWTKGVGSYGEGWGNAGSGIRVRQGDTLYIKYHSNVEDAALCYADHGRKAGGWRAIGPTLADGIGRHSNEPVILKISDVGTPKSTVAWVSGPGKSGIWSGLVAPGPYDLALHDGARWTLPPIVVSELPKRGSFWASLAGWLNPETPAPTEPIHSVPEEGLSVILLAFACLSLAAVRRMWR